MPVPPAGRERAEAWLAGGVEEVPARDAATVLLVRDSPRGLEVYLQRRAGRLAFAGGMHAFPGGVVDPGDHAADLVWAHPPDARDAEHLGASPGALVCAAARELLEECGVLLAQRADGGPAGPVRARDRAALLAGGLRFADLLARDGHALSARLLRPWSRWVTPPDQPRRYDTRFLLAALPPGQEPVELGAGSESEAGGWERPGEVLRRHGRGECAMLLPTAQTLAELTPWACVADVHAHAADRPAGTVRPRVVRRDGRLLIVAGDER